MARSSSVKRVDKIEKLKVIDFFYCLRRGNVRSVFFWRRLIVGRNKLCNFIVSVWRCEIFVVCHRTKRVGSHSEPWILYDFVLCGKTKEDWLPIMIVSVFVQYQQFIHRYFSITSFHRDFTRRRKIQFKL